MKSKKFIYLLISGVLLVWGLIIYRIFGSFDGGDDVAAVAVVQRKESFNDYTVPKDTTRLLLNYRDPFGEAKHKDTAEIPVSRLIRKQAIKPLPVVPMNWGFIQYAGYMHNPSSKKLIAVVRINGNSRMLAEGENADGVKLVKNMKDSIKVIYNGKTKFITLKPVTL